MILLAVGVIPSSSPAVIPRPLPAARPVCGSDDIVCALEHLTDAVQANNDSQFFSTLFATLIGAAAAFGFSWLLARRERAQDQWARDREYERAREDRNEDRQLDREERGQDRRRDRMDRQAERRLARRESNHQRALDRQDAYDAEMAQLWREYVLRLTEVSWSSRGDKFPIVQELWGLTTRVEITAKEEDADVFAAMRPRLEEWMEPESPHNRRRAIEILKRYMSGEFDAARAVHEFTHEASWRMWAPLT